MAAVEAEKSTKLALDFAEKSYEAGRSTIYDLNNAKKKQLCKLYKLQFLRLNTIIFLV